MHDAMMVKVFHCREDVIQSAQSIQLCKLSFLCNAVKEFLALNKIRNDIIIILVICQLKEAFFTG